MNAGIGRYLKQEYIWATARIALGWMLFWAFIDKVFGLGFSTTPQQSWLSGASPTSGFLKFGVSGLFADLFKAMAGNILVDVLFMAGLLLIGIALLLGIGTKIAGYAGALLMFILYLTNVPPLHNPLIDEHIIYLIVLIGIANVKAGHTWGLGKWWSNTSLVKRFPILE
ncbi:MAG: hypothetical protein QHH00_01735 [Methanomassiliicoccales archaeon]|jgi:thiosulfate dehydrogenase [quinone] large subunit|nr:hypothetical protein [Methanomassiliicoccales archaeon]